MLSLPMIHIVAAHDFDPEYEAQFYALTPNSPLLSPEAIGIKAGQSLYAIGYDPKNGLYFATNCKQLPFCSIATTGYIPAQVFFPVQGVNSTVKQQQLQLQNGNVSDEATPRHSAGLSTPGSEMEAEGAGEVHHVVRGHGWEVKAAHAEVAGMNTLNAVYSTMIFYTPKSVTYWMAERNGAARRLVHNMATPETNVMQEDRAGREGDGSGR
ncbi:hypothetical protein BJ742DRAFT_739370 [Cladochytrium replicatum]|nr:hypothetical protein BJ742DRAFT_739370 [Cladochytrium replicatum]